jgi:hypothetical protein
LKKKKTVPLRYDLRQLDLIRVLDKNKYLPWFEELPKPVEVPVAKIVEIPVIVRNKLPKEPFILSKSYLNNLNIFN